MGLVSGIHPGSRGSRLSRWFPENQKRVATYARGGIIEQLEAKLKDMRTREAALLRESEPVTVLGRQDWNRTIGEVKGIIQNLEWVLYDVLGVSVPAHLCDICLAEIRPGEQIHWWTSSSQRAPLAARLAGIQLAPARQMRSCCRCMGHSYETCSSEAATK
jgi:hypothetical protein